MYRYCTTPNAYRSRVLYYEKAINIPSDIVTEDEESVKYREEYKDKYKQREWYNAYRRSIREEIRLDNLKDEIKEAADKFSKLPSLKLSENTDNLKEKEAVLLFSDLHIGVECDNYYNKYNSDIAVKRLNSLRDQVIEYCRLNKVSTLHFLNLGDAISGLIHTNARIEQQMDVAEQVIVADVLSSVDGLIFSLQKLIENKKAIKQGTMQELLTGKKRLPGFNGKWINTTLGRCFNKIVGGGTPSRAIPEFWNGEIPWATVKDFATFNPYKTQEYISEAGLNHSSTHLIPKGTLITSTRMGIGKIVIYYVDVAINQDLKALFVSDDVSKEYIYHLFGMVGKIIESLGNGSTVKGVRIEQLKNLSIVLPKKNEQQAIAQVLSDMDSEIEQLEKKLFKYKQIKQGMMQELLTGRIRLV